MAYIFGDGFDCYAATTDAVAGYWDSGNTANFTLTAGRFAGSQGIQNVTSSNTWLTKSSAVNDAVHHIVCAFRQTVALSGSTLASYFQLTDNVTNQCCIVFRSDGVILLTSATPGGTVLATTPALVTAQNTWFAFEFEVIISATVGRFRVRKNGNSVDDFDSGASLNTRPGANAYANKLTIGQNASPGSGGHQFDDLLWRSDAAAVPFVGDIRCYTRRPASDATAVFSRLGGATNTSQVSETLQDGLTTYVFSPNVNDADFYNIVALTPAPASVVAVTTRGFVTKSDAGTKGAAVQLKSGGTTVTSTPTLLATTFGWLWRTDTTNPNGGAAWTAGAVDSVQIGPKVTS